MYFLTIDSENTQFKLTNCNENLLFSGTVRGAIKLNEVMIELKNQGFWIQSSSDLNHPNEFPNFEEYSIDIAAGYYDGALKAGVIEIERN